MLHTLKWDAVLAAVEYNVYVDGVFVINVVGTLELDLTSLSDPASGPKIIHCSVAAVDVNGTEGFMSNLVEYYVPLTAPQNVRIE